LSNNRFHVVPGRAKKFRRGMPQVLVELKFHGPAPAGMSTYRSRLISAP
jgi:hypothetical protein